MRYDDKASLNMTEWQKPYPNVSIRSFLHTELSQPHSTGSFSKQSILNINGGAGAPNGQTNYEYFNVSSAHVDHLEVFYSSTGGKVRTEYDLNGERTKQIGKDKLGLTHGVHIWRDENGEENKLNFFHGIPIPDFLAKCLQKTALFKTNTEFTEMKKLQAEIKNQDKYQHMNRNNFNFSQN